MERIESPNLNNSLNIDNGKKRKELRDMFEIKGKDIYIIKWPDFVLLPAQQLKNYGKNAKQRYRKIQNAKTRANLRIVKMIDWILREMALNQVLLKIKNGDCIPEGFFSLKAGLIC